MSSSHLRLSYWEYFNALNRCCQEGEGGKKVRKRKSGKESRAVERLSGYRQNTIREVKN